MAKQFIFRLVFSFLMSTCMVFLMSAWVTYVNIGFSVQYWGSWFRAFLSAWPVGFVVVLFLAPLVQKLTGKIVKVKKE